jgi:phosphoglucosamine mutase
MGDTQLLDSKLPSPEHVGRLFPVRDAVGRYVVSLKSTFPKKLTLEGMSIVLDCANGAAYQSAPNVFEELGAHVHVLAAAPDGFNINHDYGALHPDVCQRKVLETGSDLGVALDGDADRAIFIDNKGQVVGGDQIMFLNSVHLKEKNALSKNAIAATIMSNMALEIALQREGIKLYRTQVGDRYVAECLRRKGLNFGGEQSGHLIFLDHATTGDGTLAALQTLAIMKESGYDLATLAKSIVPFPQILINVKVENPSKVEEHPLVGKMLKDAQIKLKNKGRIVLRPSGTEPVVRVMVEGEDESQIKIMAQECASLVKSWLK